MIWSGAGSILSYQVPFWDGVDNTRTEKVESVVRSVPTVSKMRSRESCVLLLPPLIIIQPRNSPCMSYMIIPVNLQYIRVIRAVPGCFSIPRTNILESLIKTFVEYFDNKAYALPTNALFFLRIQYSAFWVSKYGGRIIILRLLLSSPNINNNNWLCTRFNLINWLNNAIHDLISAVVHPIHVVQCGRYSFESNLNTKKNTIVPLCVEFYEVFLFRVQTVRPF